MTDSDRNIETDPQENCDCHCGNIRKDEIQIILAGMDRLVCGTLHGKVQLIVVHCQRNCLSLADDSKQQRERKRDIVLGLDYPVAFIDFESAGTLCFHDGAQLVDDERDNLEHKTYTKGNGVTPLFM